MKLKRLVYYAIISALTYGAYYIWFDDGAPTPEAATAWDGEATQIPPARQEADPKSAPGAPESDLQKTH